MFQKVGSDTLRQTYKLVPLLDFTNNSDIDWIKTINEINQQFYKKYNLSVSEIKYIEEKFKSME